ncbi:MAG: hypothetical protein KY432_11605, partial [Acidobacteria bacterium]|nr:hypothetical protein [Acidobacteriota bacterium]
MWDELGERGGELFFAEWLLQHPHSFVAGEYTECASSDHVATTAPVEAVISAAARASSVGNASGRTPPGRRFRKSATRSKRALSVRALASRDCNAITAPTAAAAARTASGSGAR